jgi:hypothetical protein
MKKTICDLCDQPIEGIERPAFVLNEKVHETYIIVTVQANHRDADVCKPCLRLALREITDEPSFRRLTDHQPTPIELYPQENP